MARVPMHVRYVQRDDVEITAGGVDIRNAVSAIAFEAGSLDAVGTLTLTLRAPVLEVDGKQIVRIPPETHAALVALGWTPPPGANEHEGHALKSMLPEEEG